MNDSNYLVFKTNNAIGKKFKLYYKVYLGIYKFYITYL